MKNKDDKSLPLVIECDPKEQFIEDEPKKMGRKRIPIDTRQVAALAEINCTAEEMSAVLNISVDTLHNRFSAVIKEGRAKGRTSLRRWMHQKAESGSAVMMIWLSKNILGYTDKVENVNADKTFVVKSMDGKVKLSIVSEEDFYDRKKLSNG